MTQKRYGTPLALALASAVLVGIASLVSLVLKGSSDRDRFERVRRGMTQAEVIAVMGRNPDQWCGAVHDSATSPWPPWDDALVDWLIWESNVHDVAQVHLNPAGRVDRKSWTDHDVPSFWERVRRRLHL